jgi:thioredoxin-related protein
MINPNDKKNKELLKKYKDRTMPAAMFCLFNGKYTTKIVGVCKPTNMLSNLKKLKRKNKSAWKKEKKKRDKKKKEEEAKAKEDKKDEDKKDE